MAEEKEMSTKLENIVEAMKEKLDLIAEAILGDPTDASKPGVIIRIDRLERSDRLKTKMMWLIGTGIVAAGLQILYSSL